MMNFKRLDCYFGCSEDDFNYVRINIYEVDSDFIFNENLITEFFKSNAFENEYYEESRVKKKNLDFLPFPFNTKNIDVDDFQLIEDNWFEKLSNLFDVPKQKEKLSDFKKLFVKDLEFAQEYLKKFSIQRKCYFLTINNYHHTSEKIHQLYHEVNFVMDYFYLIILKVENCNQLITIELGYD